ncbi:hypothetical protein [Ancylobacter terrae]|uniref:hypothetical protein n=1 Tax=Ancylobacter sp. sgz301288 TaxID=3342077 RepID=UPI0038580D78
MSDDAIDFRADNPLHLRIGTEIIEVRSLKCAIDLIRSLRGDGLGEYAGMLLAQMRAARTEPQLADAWVAFLTWSQACGLDAQHPRVPQRRAA